MEHVRFIENPELGPCKMVLAFTGWMDGGDVSTGTVEHLISETGARKLAQIKPEPFYLYSFPGGMEVSALFRPEVDFEEGVIMDFEEPRNLFYYAEEKHLILFKGKEPHLRWREFAECILDVAEQFQVQHLYFVGSVAGVVPHTREPRFTSSVSSEGLKAELEPLNFKFTNYSGPGSITTQLLYLAGKRNIPMTNIVAEIPAYIQGRNPKCIEATLKRLMKLLNLEDLDMELLKVLSEEMEEKLDKAIEDHDELSEHIKTLEEQYDEEMFDEDMGELKQWLQKRGIRLD